MLPFFKVICEKATDLNMSPVMMPLFTLALLISPGHLHVPQGVGPGADSGFPLACS